MVRRIGAEARDPTYCGRCVKHQAAKLRTTLPIVQLAWAFRATLSCLLRLLVGRRRWRSESWCSQARATSDTYTRNEQRFTDDQDDVGRSLAHDRCKRGQRTASGESKLRCRLQASHPQRRLLAHTYTVFPDTQSLIRSTTRLRLDVAETVYSARRFPSDLDRILCAPWSE